MTQGGLNIRLHRGFYRGMLWLLDRINTSELKLCCGPRQVHLLDTKLSKIVLGGTAALRVLSGVGGGTSF
jgi:hypothetical protein